MFSTDFIFRQQENLVDNKKCRAGFRLLCNKIPLFLAVFQNNNVISKTKLSLKILTQLWAFFFTNEVTNFVNLTSNLI